jgi:general secretion pathway protein L
MAETLLIRLGSQRSDRIHWLITSTNNQEIIGSGELTNADELAQLTEKAKQRQVIVVVSGADVLLKQLNVPAKSQRAVKLAAPYMLEDEIAQDVEGVFFAYHHLKSTDKQHNCFVAAVDKEQMENWLLWLSDAGIRSIHMIPESLAMPFNDDGYSVIQLEQQIIVRTQAWQSMTIDPATWGLLVTRWQQQEDIRLNCYSPLSIEGDNITVNVMPEELPLAIFAKHIDKNSFNLLQGDYQAKKQRTKILFEWQLVASLLLVVLLFNIAEKGVHLVSLKAQEQQLKDDIVGTYKKAFPTAKKVNVATVKSQLKRKLSDINQGSSEHKFMAMLEKLQPAFASVRTLTPDTLRFDGKRQELRIQVSASSYQDFELFKAELEKAQLSVTVGSQNNQGDKVVGSFMIKEGA